MTSTAPVRFTFAISSYDHVRDVVDGRIAIEGAEVRFLRLPIPEMFRRFVAARDCDVSEMSFVQYAAIRASGDESIVGIPVFPSRMYRHTAIFVRSDRVVTPDDLRGGRIGIVAWANSAAVWGRGLLSDMYGIRVSDAQWIQGGVERPGRFENVAPAYLPDDVSLRRETERGIEEMLWSGDLEAIIVPAPPASVRASADSGGVIRRLFEHPAEAEREYRERTGCLPIMHVVAMTRQFADRDPSLPARLYRALDSARLGYFERLRDPGVSRLPLPWLDEHLRSVTESFGGDAWPYGVDANRATIATALRYLHEHGLVIGDWRPDDLFPEWRAAMSAPSIETRSG